MAALLANAATNAVRRGLGNWQGEKNDSPNLRWAKGTVRGKISNLVAKGKEIGNNVAAKAKATGAKPKAAGVAAKAHVSRNRAAYIAGGIGASADVAGMAIASRKKAAQGEKLNCATPSANNFFAFQKCLVFKRENDFCNVPAVG